MRKSLFILCPISFLLSCSSSKVFNPDKKFPQQELQKDYTIFRNILEENHPSLYWYTTKDSLDYYFDNGYTRIGDSMTEPAFKTLLSYVISKINCGHTSVKYSKRFTKYLDTSLVRQFPLSIKLWEDSAVLYANLNRKDSVLKRGTVIKAINGAPISFYRDTMFQFISADGYNIHHKDQTLSNRGAFAGWYRNIFGLDTSFNITYVDSTNEEKTIRVPIYDPKKDSLFQKQKGFTRSRKKKRITVLPENNIQIDTSGNIALLTLATFTSGHRYRHLIRKSFSTLDQQKIKHLVIDVRNNGGGDVGNSTLLTKYIADRKFKLADSLYAINKKSRYGKYIRHNFRNNIFMSFMSKKRSDGKYHFGYFEKHYFKPKTTHHFDGDVYVIIGGNSFSATTLFVNTIKNQQNVKLIGEETGGGSYGNTAWLIPDAVLPFTRLRFRLPKYRCVENKDQPKTGRGIFPDIEVRPTKEDIKTGTDPKLVKALELCRMKLHGQ